MGNFPLGFPDCSYGAVPVSVLRVREEDKRDESVRYCLSYLLASHIVYDTPF